VNKIVQALIVQDGHWQTMQRSMNPHDGWLTNAQVKVACVSLYQLMQQIVNCHPGQAPIVLLHVYI
jgi:hypothetical protein